jgi:MFS transporter, DHA3 family, macrolide efflux protein
MSELTTPETTLSAKQVFNIRDFRLLWFAYLISEFGNSLTTFALIILVNNLTGSTASVASMALAVVIPQVIFGLIAGVFVDRWNTKRVMIVSDFVRGILVLGFIPAVMSHQMWLIYALGFVQATVGTFFSPARMSFMPSVVPENGLMAANAMTGTARVAATMLGGGAVGAMIGVFNVSWPIFAVDAITFFASVLLVNSIRSKASLPEEDAESETTPGFFQEFKQGMAYIAQSASLTGLMIVVGISEIGLGATQVLYAPFFTEELRVSAAWLGPEETVSAAAMALGGALLTILAAKFKPQVLAPLGLLILGLGLGAVAAVTNVWLIMVTALITGIFIIPMQSSISTIFQRSCAPQLRGRVGSTITTVFSAASLLSIVGTGLLGDLLGLRTLFLAVGTITALAGVIAWFLFRPSSLETATTPASAAPASA